MRTVAKIHRNGGFEGPGELAVAQYLEHELPDSWDVICNKELPSQNSSRELDFIVVADNVIFAVEEKHWHGRVGGNETAWVLSSGESRKSPLNQVKEASSRLNSLLRKDIPGLDDLAQDTRVIQDLVLMSAECQLAVRDPRVHSQVLMLDGCESDFLRLDERQPKRASIAPLRDDIVARLTQLPDQPEIPTRIRDYKVLEVLQSIGPVTSVLAQHEDGSRRMLKIVRRPTTVNPEQAAAREHALLREYEALRELGSTGVTPAVQDYFSWDRDTTWVYPIDAPDGHSLRADLVKDLPSVEKIRIVVPAAFESLAAIHAAGVVHRGITPGRVWLSPSGHLLFTDFQVARLPASLTIAESVDELDPENAFRAPECRVDPSLARPASDVFSLAASLYTWVTGSEPDEWEASPPDLATQRFDLPHDLLQGLSGLFVVATQSDPSLRPSAADVAASLRTLGTLTQINAESGDEPQPGDMLFNRYRVVRFLGAGATATTYLVEDTYADTSFVMKRIQDRHLAERLGLAEFKHLLEMNHYNLVRVYDVYPPEEAVHLRIEYIAGSRLADLGDRFVGKTPRVLHIAEQLLQALKYLEDRHRIHRDVSPKNIMVPDEEDEPIKLIDFGLATLAEDATTAVGTPLYRAPEIDQGSAWSSSCDLYSAAIVLFQTLTGRLPYVLQNGVPMKDVAAPPGEQERRECGEAVLDVLLRAASWNPEQRFASASDLWEALRNASIVGPAHETEGAELVNPTVNEIRGLFRNSSFGNADNRGLDSVFANDTYVATALDAALGPALLKDSLRFVVLSGNPGDGKTAFLQRFRDSLLAAGYSDVREADEAGWRMGKGVREIGVLYDASESHGDISADELLEAVLAPLTGPRPPVSEYTAVIAANDGRLLDFFERRGPDRYPWLWERIRRLLDDSTEPMDGVALVDLKRRSVVGSGSPLFERILKELTAEDRWRVCDGCTARVECPMRFNALSFDDPEVGPQVRAQLGELLMTVHLRRERRPTIRDLRSALAFLITQDISCEQVHSERHQDVAPLLVTGRPYFNAAFDASGGPDLLLDQWQQLDPAAVPSPRLDRFLFFNRKRPLSAEMVSAFVPPATRPPIVGIGATDEDWLQAMKRRYFFEGSPATEAIDLPAPTALLPYRYLKEFEAVLRGDTDVDAVLTRLLLGMSRADGVPVGALSGDLAFRTSEAVDVDDEVVVIKLFPRSKFMVVLNEGETPFVESMSDRLMLAHSSGGSKLAVGLDLFEFLCRSADGLLPGSLEQRPLLEDLATFKHHLLAIATERVSLSEAGRRVHNVVAQAGELWLGGGP